MCCRLRRGAGILSAGITQDISTDLSNTSALEAIARNTAFQFKGQSFDFCAIARKLGVSHAGVLNDAGAALDGLDPIMANATDT